MGIIWLRLRRQNIAQECCDQHRDASPLVEHI